MDSSIVNWHTPTGGAQFLIDTTNGVDSPTTTGNIACVCSAGSITGTVLTIVTVDSGTISVGDTVFFIDVPLPAGLQITSFGTGTGGAGTYNLNASTTASNLFGIWMCSIPFKTIQAALDYASRFSYLNFVTANFVIGRGTYSENIFSPGILGNGTSFSMHFPSPVTIDGQGPDSPP